ncbi:putative membrane protein AbrB (regulator of aidB expression) [Methanococcus voltae PS]|uniref:Membrane protein AbrB (Regulator of aidB expression) n=1 Tax=Methanococcus voltae PS TaxID=523842 RepID=A0ABT2EZY1_METVO|nr:hypothetical protein [Methanococcus voltae]MCS3922720.1 putative membrane protein AbrB (regulator of aidB expression) [Methanococcus voltae PS]
MGLANTTKILIIGVIVWLFYKPLGYLIIISLILNGLYCALKSKNLRKIDKAIYFLMAIFVIGVTIPTGFLPDNYNGEQFIRDNWMLYAIAVGITVLLIVLYSYRMKKYYIEVDFQKKALK